MIARVDNAVREVCLQADIPVSVPRLLPGDVHIWWASLDQLGSRLPIFEEILSGDEKARAERFHFERDRNRFIARRGVLREILGCYLGIEPSTLRFVYGKNGKPSIADKGGCGDIEFSLSHSNGAALYGFCRGHQIGVDIECIREFPEMGQIAGQFFSKKENELLCRLHGTEKVAAFFKCWTRKEALTKAIGDGLFLPLNQFNVLDKTGDKGSHGQFSCHQIGRRRAQICNMHLESGIESACALLMGEADTGAECLNFLRSGEGVTRKVFRQDTNCEDERNNNG